MARIEAIPLKQIGRIKFDMNRSDVRMVLGKYKEFKKSIFSKNTTDDFGYCHIYYSESDTVDAIELFGDAEVLLKGIQVFPANFDDVKKEFGNITGEDGYYTNTELSIGISLDDNKIVSILFGKKGYYSNI